MKGKYIVTLKIKKLKYEIEVKRKFTIVEGNSATGKTTLVDLVTLYRKKGKGSGVSIQSRVPVVAISDLDWGVISKKENHIFLIDEDVASSVCVTEDFARLANISNNYFIIITRVPMPMIPYSVSEIYTLNKDSLDVQQGYTINKLFPKYRDKDFGGIPDLVIVEDSKSGYEFFSKTLSCECISSGGNSNVKSILLKCALSGSYSCIFCIVDGSAFGAFVNDVFDLAESLVYNCTIGILAPECFEWLILKSGLECVQDCYLEETYNYCDTRDYSHWEQYYADLLKEVSSIRTKGYLSYEKGSTIDKRYITNSKKVYTILNDLDLSRRK